MSGHPSLKVNKGPGFGECIFLMYAFICFTGQMEVGIVWQSQMVWSQLNLSIFDLGIQKVKYHQRRATWEIAG